MNQGQAAMGGMRQAVAFLTPLGGARPPSPAALRWFPLVGAVMGVVLGLGWWVADRLWPAVAAAALVVAADLALTGLLHLDGLVDSADGLLPPLARERRLEVMAEPNVGAFGVGVAGTTLLLRWAAVSVLSPAPLLLAGLWCGSRTAMVAMSVRLPYARRASPEPGLAQPFLGGRVAPAAVLGAGLALACCAAWWPLAGPVALGAGAVAAAAVGLLARRRLGGFTGDVLGATGMVAETVGLVVAAARW